MIKKHDQRNAPLPAMGHLAQESHTPVALGNGEGWKAHYAFLGRSGFTETANAEVKIIRPSL
jgi:hypothetical protein